MGTWFLFEGRKCSKIDWGDDCITVIKTTVLETTECTLKMGELCGM